MVFKEIWSLPFVAVGGSLANFPINYDFMNNI